MSSRRFDSVLTRLVKAASSPQRAHTALSLVTSSAMGTSDNTSLKGFCWNVASSAATMTVLPARAHNSQQLRQVPEELALVHAHDVKRVHDVGDVGESRARHGGEGLAVVRDDVSLRRRAGLVFVPRVPGVLHHQTLAVRHLVPADAARQLRGLAGKHGACGVRVFGVLFAGVRRR
jgi:hypothetical protein